MQFRTSLNENNNNNNNNKYTPNSDDYCNKNIYHINNNNNNNNNNNKLVHVLFWELRSEGRSCIAGPRRGNLLNKQKIYIAFSNFG